MSVTADKSQDPIALEQSVGGSFRHPLIAVRICAVFFGAHSVVEYYRGCTVGGRFRVMITLRVRVLVRVQASAWVTSRGRSRFRVSKVLGQSQGYG